MPPIFNGYLMDFEQIYFNQYKNTCTGVLNNVLHGFSFLQSKQLRTSVWGNICFDFKNFIDNKTIV